MPNLFQHLGYYIIHFEFPKYMSCRIFKNVMPNLFRHLCACKSRAPETSSGRQVFIVMPNFKKCHAEFISASMCLQK